MYAVASVDHDAFRVELVGHKMLLHSLSSEVVEAIEKLPYWHGPESYQAYQKFFREWGTHVITACNYGARYQLKVEQEKSSSSTKQSFEASVKIEYQGAFGISASGDVKKDKAYDEYMEKRSTEVFMYSGSSADSIVLANNETKDPDKYQAAYKAWATSVNNANATSLVTVKVDSIANILVGTGDSTLVGLGESMNSALAYVPDVYPYTVVLAIQSLSPPTDFIISGHRGVQAPKPPDAHDYSHITESRLRFTASPSSHPGTYDFIIIAPAALVDFTLASKSPLRGSEVTVVSTTDAKKYLHFTFGTMEHNVTQRVDLSLLPHPNT
ncbi:hypothetical protein BJY00DRAFT_297588 [Aspergillus carlsbadensis]|nr:hypothetical protein BJY00DRAFT_297588 [Aspergillus carlsbadensis]